jgi:hypothetical protein
MRVFIANLGIADVQCNAFNLVYIIITEKGKLPWQHQLRLTT